MAVETKCPGCGRAMGDPEDEWPLHVNIGLDVSVQGELDNDGNVNYLNHTPSGDEVTGGSLCCKFCGWYRDLELDELRLLLGDSAPMHLSALTANVVHPSITIDNAG